MWKEYIIRREELYDKIWTKPMVEIAKEYGLSDKAIAKICNKLNVPVPGVGYWQKLEAGENLKRKPLPDIKPTDPTEHRISKRVPEYDIVISEEAQKRIEEENDPSNKIIVPEKRTNIHWLIKKTELSLEAPYRAKKFLNSSNEEGVFKLYVSAENLKRALRILDTLIKSLEKRKYLVYINRGLLCVKLYGVEIGFFLKENSKRIELKKESVYSFRDYDFLPTGIFVLSIEDFNCQHLIQRNFADLKSVKVEDRLNEFIIGLIIASQAKIAHELYLERQHKLWEEKEKKRKELLRAIENERKKIKTLRRNATRHYNSNLIRQYITQYKLKLLDETLTPEKRQEIMDYIDWALKQADRLDPLVKSPSSVLDNIIPGKYDFGDDEYWENMGEEDE